MGLHTSVFLDDYIESFIYNRISAGRFKNVSEVIREGLRLLEEEENKIIILKNLIIVGINSGDSKNFDAKKHLAKLKLARKKNT